MKSLKAFLRERTSKTKNTKTNKDKLYVKWRGYSNNFNSWIDKNSVTKNI